MNLPKNTLRHAERASLCPGGPSAVNGGWPDSPLDSPKDTLALSGLPERWGLLAFLFPDQRKPAFGNDREAVTRQAANARGWQSGVSRLLPV